jgi:hypothetical protein
VPLATHLFRYHAIQERIKDAAGAFPAERVPGCWWRDSIKRTLRLPVSLHPRPIDLSQPMIPVPREESPGSYVCPYCDDTKPKFYAYLGVAVKHIQQRHKFFWELLSDQAKLTLLASRGKELTRERWLELVRPGPAAATQPAPAVGPILLPGLPTIAAPAPAALELTPAPAKRVPKKAVGPLPTAVAAPAPPTTPSSTLAKAARSVTASAPTARLAEPAPPPAAVVATSAAVSAPSKQRAKGKQRLVLVDDVSDHRPHLPAEPLSLIPASPAPPELPQGLRRKRGPPALPTAEGTHSSTPSDSATHTSKDHLTPSEPKRKPVPRHDE